MPVCDVPQRLKYRNLLYTAVTRAKKLMILVGHQSVIDAMIQNDRQTLRYTGLLSMIEERL